MVDGIVDNEAARKTAEQETAAEEFKRKLIVADGELIPLAKHGPKGEDLFIASRFFPIPGPNVDIAGTSYDREDPHFYKEIDGVLYIELYAQREGDLVPIGKVDWQKEGEEANGHASVRYHVRIENQKEHEEKAAKFWDEARMATIAVSPEFENMGLGTLLIASSALVLHDRGATHFSPTVLLKGSVQGAIGKFVNIDKVVDSEGLASPKKGRIDKYFESPSFNKIFKDFAVPRG